MAERPFVRPPPVNISELPVNKPTNGWDKLFAPTNIKTQLPATVEEYFWGANGSKFGVNGNYLGVSWFSTKVMVPAGFKGKHIELQFESARLRAEVFVNRKLVAYDIASGTPFGADVSNALIPGQVNEIAVRITDPNGNFDWRDSQTFMWGDYRIQPTHGFGGITGKVHLCATDQTYISDVFVKNTPEPKQVDVEVSLTGKQAAGNYQLVIKENKTGKVVFTNSYPANNAVEHFKVDVPTAQLWDVDHPNLYNLTVNWTGKNGTHDAFQRRFGFRWFAVKDVNGDQQFYLNGKRIVVRTSISWGFWPVNGIAPTDELARKQVLDAKRIGLNMLNFHRTIGQPNVLDAADELGLLYFEEPGGNQFPDNLFEAKNDIGKKQRDFYLPTRTEKFLRMVKRDRNHPSLVIYNMHNERGAQPRTEDRDEMMAGHKLDNSRIITYNSSNGPIKQDEPDARFKLHLFPYDDNFYDYGWFDQHHAGGPGVYHDALYNSPTSYAKYTDHKNEIIYYGEEGAIGTPPRLQLIHDEIMKRGKNIGWETDTYLKWYDAYDSFLKNNGFSKAFPNVDSLTRKMGNVAYYYQGRVIENVHINNIIDGYAINGWESMKQENHSGMVDDYRNLKGDPDLIARYNRPLYVAVKLNHKVVPAGQDVTADFFIVNEKDIKGDAELDIQVKDATGKVYASQKEKVKVTGGSTYGELLVKGIKVNVPHAGYTTVSAVLKQGQTTICNGDDQIYAVQLNKQGVSQHIMVADSGLIQRYLKSEGIAYTDYHSGTPEGNVLIIGSADPQQTGNPLVTDILEWVNNGNTLVVLGNTEKWADHLARKEAAEFKGIQVLGTSWYGGNYFVKSHPLFAGLPQACVFNWEYQCLAAYNKNRIGMRMWSGETIVGCVSDHKQEVYSALSIIPHGRGRIILNALDLTSCIKSEKATKRAEGDGENASMNTFNTTASNPANVVGQQLLLNMLKF
ncbi:glycosyl hydrolase family 2 [Mucilaginibacter yixingensis]|uniref:Glycosyl hydrolase family 2 n=1 Tax=Mucilaginibacter yixingensis TaxID=1295612 RepID=A0A2T5JB69_9SPHI|nr:glycoside hydrolase family 2 TIM barrel-domain containing protein [Mucilaginibacter yixingensis]PTQ98113.1 glycosyl hydrolase family 2 [Mucilaginibacter yixingensis]